MAPEQAQAADAAFVPLLAHSQAPLRRSAAACIAALCEAFPIPRHSAAVAAVLSGQNNKEPVPAALRHGTLTCLLAICRVRRTDPHDDEDPLRPVLPTILQYCAESLRCADDQAAIGAALEVVLQLLTEHGNKFFLWDDSRCTRLWDEISSVLLVLAFDDASRVSSKAVAIGCLAGLYRIRPRASHELLFSSSTTPPGEEKTAKLETTGKLVDLLSDPDPLLRGNTVALLGEIIASNLRLKQEAVLRQVCEVTAVIEVMIGCFKDRSSVSAKMACQALSGCIDPLLHSGDCKLRECALAIVAAFLGTSVDAYWLIKLEVADALSKVDFRALTFLESTLEGTPHLSGNIQRQALDYILGLLASADARIRHGASLSLLEMPAHIWAPPQLDRDDFVQETLSETSVWPVDSALQYHRGVALLARALIQNTLISHPPSQLKGSYHALLLLFRKYGALYDSQDAGQLLSDAPNPLCSYACDIMPLVVERLVSSSLALDLDAHIDMVSLVGHLARQARSFFDPFSAAMLRHCLRLLNIVCFIMESRNPPPSRDLRPGNSYFSPSKATANFLGTFSGSQAYIDLFLRLFAAHTAYLTNAGGSAGGSVSVGSTSQIVDRFAELRRCALETLAGVIRCIGSRIAQYHEEVLFYLLKFFDTEPRGSALCAAELFKAMFTVQLPVSLPPASPRGQDEEGEEDDGIFAAWHFEQYEFVHQSVTQIQQAQAAIGNFEPLVQYAMETFSSSNDGKAKAAVLRLLITMLDGGINYAQLDPEFAFLEAVVSQCEEGSNYLITPSATLPAIVEFLHVLFAVKCVYSKALSGDTLMRIATLPSLSASSISWRAASIAFRSSLSTMFCQPLEKTPPILVNYQEAFFKHVLSRFPEPQSVETATVIMFKARSQQATWDAFSHMASRAVVAFLRNLKESQLACFGDLWRLCTLCSLVNPDTILQDSWGLLIASSSKFSATKHPDQPIAPSSRLDASLEQLGLQWLPGFVVAARMGVGVRRELLLRSAGAHMKTSPDTEVAACADDDEAAEMYIISSVVDAAIHTAAQIIGHLHIEELASCAVLALKSAVSLLRYLAKTSPFAVAKFALSAMSLSSDSRHPFRALLIADDTPLKLVCEICSLLRLLSMSEDGASEAIVFFCSVLESKIAAKNRSLCAQTNSCTHCMLGELCRCLASCRKAHWKLPTVVLDAIVQSRSLLPAASECLEPILANPENHDAAMAVVHNCVHPSLTHKGASNALFIISRLPPSLAVLTAIVRHMLSSEAPSLKRAADMQVVRCIRHLQEEKAKRADPQGEDTGWYSEIKGLYRGFLSVTKSPHIFSESHRLFQELVQEPVVTALPPTPFSAGQVGPDDENFGLRTVSSGQTIEYIAKRIKLSPHANFSRYVALVVSLGGTHFHDLLASGELDWNLSDFVMTEACDAVCEEVCDYLQSKVAALKDSVQPVSRTPLCSGAWLREVALCSSVVSATIRFHKLVRARITPGDQLELATIFLSQFLVQWGGMVGSPFDLVPVFQFTAHGLYDFTSVNPITAESMPPQLARLIPPLFEVYRLVVLSQSLQASALIERAVQQAPFEARQSVMVQALIAGTIIGDLGDDCHYGRSFIDAVMTLLLTLARKFPDMIYPMLSGAPDASETLDMPLFKLCQQLESPELSMRLSLFFLTTAGMESSTHFLEVHGSLRAILTAPDPDSLGISEELRCLSLRGLTALLLKACLQDGTEDKLRMVLTMPSFRYEHEYAVSRAKRLNRLVPLQEIIYTAIARIRESSPALPVSQTLELQQRSTAARSVSPDVVHLPTGSAASAAAAAKGGEHVASSLASLLFSDVCREDNFKKLSLGQVGLSELRQQTRNFVWKGINVSGLIAELISIVDVLLAIGPPNPAQNPQQQPPPRFSFLQIEALNALVLLSDLFDAEQSEWLFSLLSRLFALLVQDTTDFILMSNIISGVLKGIALFDKADPAGAKLTADCVKFALESENASLFVAALTGIRFLLEARDTRLVSPQLLVYVTKFIMAELGKPHSERTVLHLLATGFGVTESFPKETNANGFSKKLVVAAIEMSNKRDCSVVVSQAVFRGLGMLLSSHSLSPDLAAMVEEFSLRKLQHPTHSSNSIRSFLALGLLLSCMYSDGDVVVPSIDVASPGAEVTPTLSPPLGAAEPAGMSRMERVQTLFANIRRGMFSQQSNALIEVMARLIVDGFQPDEALSFILGAFAKHRSGQETVAQILFRVFTLLGPGSPAVCMWVATCIPSFLQRQTKALWTSTCVFLAASPSPLLRGLFQDVALSVEDDPDLFVLAATEFLAIRGLDPHVSADLLAALSRVQGAPFSTVVELASKVPSH